MKYILFFFLILLLCGCAAGPQETPVTQEPTVPPAPPETTLPPTEETTLPTLPPDPVEALLSSLTTEEKVGQLFLARCPEGTAFEDIRKYHLGGYILFGRDFEGQTPESVRLTVSAFQETAKIPMLIAVDEEGGTVTRVSCFSAFRVSRFPSPRQLFETAGMEAVITAEEEKAQLLSSLGINVNMAPVCDIARTPGSFMYRRSLGQDAATTAEFVTRTLEVMDYYRIGSVLKHFPGYGDNADTHTGIARDHRDRASLEESDLVPFRAGIEGGCGAILVSHTLVSAFDEEYPATLSPALHAYLREEMGFEGVIVTDDLQMQAITDLYGSGEAAVLAVLAGNDLLCCTDYPAGYQAVLEAVRSGRIGEELLNSAVRRVLTWKQDLGLGLL